MGLLTSASALAVSGDNFDYHGYMRAGTGANTAGGDQVCYNQSSSLPGNQFRLGNECGIYGENSFQYFTTKPKHPGDEYFKGNFEFQYSLNGKTQSDTTTFNVYGAYVEAGHLNGGDEVFWVGKRFYRDSDIHIDDFFYFADASGTGAGVAQIPLAGGHLAFALLQEDSAKVSTTGAVVTTQNGRPRTIMLDTRFFDIPLNQQNQLNFWLGLAGSGSGKDTVSGTNYSSNFGYVFGFKEQYKAEETTNHFAALYGQGLLQGMNLGGTFGTDPVQTQGLAFNSSANRVRLVDEVTVQTSAKFAMQAAAIYESWQLGPTLSRVQWMSLGARPTYFFDDHYSIAFELGGSRVTSTEKTMFRTTIAPQISPKSEFFSRPVLRAFLTKTYNIAEPSTSFGFQGEIWF